MSWTEKIKFLVLKHFLIQPTVSLVSITKMSYALLSIKWLQQTNSLTMLKIELYLNIKLNKNVTNVIKTFCWYCEICSNYIGRHFKL